MRRRRVSSGHARGGSPVVSLAGLRVAFENTACGVLPVVATAWVLLDSTRRGILAFDFHYNFWPGGRRLLDGLDPYDPVHQKILDVGLCYAAPAVLLFAVFATLPLGAADWLVTISWIGAALAMLRVLGLRDWRVYGALLIWWPVIVGWQTANLTLPIGLGIALLWRYRGTAVVSGLLLALLVSLKLFVWPLAVWLLATRRYSALAWSAALAAAINLVAWAVVGFDRFSEYADVTRRVASYQGPRSYTLGNLGVQLGAGRGFSYAVQFLAVAAVAICCLAAGRAGRDRSALVLAVAACLLATPVLHLHYLALLAVPLALTRPTFSAVWLLPTPLFVFPVVAPSSWKIVIALGISIAVFVVTLRPGQRSPAGRRPTDTLSA